MRRALCVVLCVLLLSSCAPRQGIEVPPSGPAPADIAAAVAERQATLPAMEALGPGDDAFSGYLEDYYQLDAAELEDGAVRFAAGAQASEIAVLLFSTQEGAENASAALEDYLERRTGEFTGYAPQQAALAEDGRALCQGCYAALLICPDADGAEEVFFACLNGEPLPEPIPSPEPGSSSEPSGPGASPEPESETEPPAEPVPVPAPEPEPVPEPESVPESENSQDPTPGPESSSEPEPSPPSDANERFDADAVLAAWRGGDQSSLTRKEQTVLDACRTVIDTFLTADMTDLEEEQTIHDWMVGWGRYDENALAHTPGSQPLPDSDNPYGFFTRRQGICLGYASTFQLFMDLLDIECITVYGWAYADQEDHAWNMVRLDGKWYCVDVTWDDPITGAELSTMAAWTDLYRRYFNVTSDFLRQTQHDWDAEGVPEAE